MFHVLSSSNYPFLSLPKTNQLSHTKEVIATLKLMFIVFIVFNWAKHFPLPFFLPYFYAVVWIIWGTKHSSWLLSGSLVFLTTVEILSGNLKVSKHGLHNKFNSIIFIFFSFLSYQQSSVNQPVNAMSSQTANAKPTPRTPDHEIQGSKEALIQDLERKLKCKDTLLHNGNQVGKLSVVSYRRPITLVKI